MYFEEQIIRCRKRAALLLKRSNYFRKQAKKILMQVRIRQKTFLFENEFGYWLKMPSNAHNLGYYLHKSTSLGDLIYWVEFKLEKLPNSDVERYSYYLCYVGCKKIYLGEAEPPFSETFLISICEVADNLIQQAFAQIDKINNQPHGRG